MVTIGCAVFKKWKLKHCKHTTDVTRLSMHDDRHGDIATGPLRDSGDLRTVLFLGKNCLRVINFQFFMLTGTHKCICSKRDSLI